MKWTKEKPKTAGFYWMRLSSEKIMVVEIYAIENGNLWVVWGGLHIPLKDMFTNREWSDSPVEPPSDV